MSFLERIFREVAAEMGKTPESLDRFKDILEENLIDTPQTLAEATQEDLEALKIPKILVKKLLSRAQQSGPAPVQPPTPTIDPVAKKRLDQLESKLSAIFRGFISDTERMDSLGMLQKVLGNIRSHPDNEKFRRLNLSNGLLHTTLFRNLDIVDLLTLLNFHRTSDGYLQVTDVDNDLLDLALKRIEQEMTAAKNKPKTFDPFAPSFSSNNPNFSVDMLKKVSDFNESSFDQRLKELIQQREELFRKHRVTPKLVAVTPNSTPVPGLDLGEGSDELRPGEELRLFKQAILDFQNNFFGEANFQNAKKKEFEKLMKEPLVLETCLRFKTPFGVYEGTFAANDTLASVFQVISRTFDLKDNSFCLGVFVNRYFPGSPEASKTLRALNLVPNAVMELISCFPSQ